MYLKPDYYVYGADPPTPISVRVGFYDGWPLTYNNGRTLWQVCFQPQHLTFLEATMMLVKERSRQLNIWAAQLDAYTIQFTRLYDNAWLMGYLGKIELASSSNLDNIWGKVYEQPRIIGESDSDYLKRLRVYISQLTGCGTKYNCEKIISSLVEYPNSCRIDTSWPAHVRIRIIDYRGCQKARDRISIINKIIPEMLAAGVDWEFYNNYYDLTATMGLLGPEEINLEARMAIKWDDADERLWMDLDADCLIAYEPLRTLDSYIALSANQTFSLYATQAIQEPVTKEFTASMSLKADHVLNVTAECRQSKSIPSNLVANAAFVKTEPLMLTATMILEED